MDVNIAQRAAAMGEYAKYAEPATHCESTLKKPSRLESSTAVRARSSKQQPPSACDTAAITQQQPLLCYATTQYATHRSITVITLYGIKNCDTVKKTQKWLDTHGIDYQYHDFREDGLDSKALAAWIEELGWQNLLNRRSTSWKALDESVRTAMDEALAHKTILSHPTLIKRPLLDTGQQRFVGFSAANYAKIFNLRTL